MINNLNFIKKYKNRRNLLSTLLKESEYKYFEDNWNKMNNAWKEIKSIITLKILYYYC